MPLVQAVPLHHMFKDAPLLASIDRLTRRVGEDLTEEVSARTPVAELPIGVTATMRGRKPGTLKESWYTTDLERSRTSTGLPKRAVEARTDDPIAPHVEWPTQPHWIRPRADRAPASVIATHGPRRAGTDPMAALRWVAPNGQVRYAHEVWHPGTSGSHMMRDALAEVDATWRQRHGRPEVNRWAREQAASF